jgi:hypothetical protein
LELALHRGHTVRPRFRVAARSNEEHESVRVRTNIEYREDIRGRADTLSEDARSKKGQQAKGARKYGDTRYLRLHAPVP